MLSAADNDTLTRVGKGTPMGELMRRYWLPVMPVDELGPPDSPPQRFRLLGEDLILFRDSNGDVGVFSETCPHRGASLFFGRNEEGGLRCVYHGWKYDVTGQCVDMPNEPDASNFKHKIRAWAYRGAVHGGVVWAYLGDGEPPGLPQLEWTLVPPEQRHYTLALRNCNWMQGLEGDIDTSHVYFLHGRLNPADSPAVGVWHHDKRPSLEVIPTDYGVVYGANREEDPDTTYWRVSQFLFPIYAFFPASPAGLVPGHIWVPIDDYHTMTWSVTWHPVNAITEADRLKAFGSALSNAPAGEMLPDVAGPLGRFRPRARKENDYEIDREAQRTTTFTGIATVFLQDQAVTESMGPIQNRSIEHLGTSDGMIIQVRRRLLNAAKAHHYDNVTPPCVDNPEWYRVRSAIGTLPKGEPWYDNFHDWLYARTNEPPPLELAVPHV